ncbi:universal stress protein [Fundidesulfovibrio terrae]|uniref:universal stress protein n=1 Tax=Fundidesulfovibrio terrae TaxID=2922866 RepID=UPI001FAF72E2|nr:universal stress protein [Fundidesulfovibrio terrae]
MGIDTILWPTDLSEGSFKSVRHVVSLAEKYNAKVVALYVAVDLCAYFPAYGNYPSPELIQQFQSWEMEEARRKLETICQGMLHGCPNLKVKLVRGNAAEEILKTAREEKAGLVVMTSRGQGLDKGPAEATGLGSVARQVLEKSTLPVQIVYP